MGKNIVLASASPRRKELLEKIGLSFSIVPSNVEENIEGKSFSNKLIEELAFQKAADVAKKVNSKSLIIGSDTVVTIDDEILGKPSDEKDAFYMLNRLSGKTHEVVSAIAIIDNETKKTLIDSVISKVTFRELREEEIKNYIKTGEPLDKAGAYAIQGIASIFISSIEGCYSNIVGISTYKLAQMLKEFDIRIL